MRRPQEEYEAYGSFWGFIKDVASAIIPALLVTAFLLWLLGVV